MQARAASTTLAYFVFRFAALAALTVGVLASVSVSASRGEDRPGSLDSSPVQYAPDTAETVNDRRYPLVYANATPQR